MRAIPLTVLKGGINRLRIKGGASADSLYDLINGQITASGTVKGRYGTRRVAELDSSTVGLVAFDDVLHTFSTGIVTVPAGFAMHVLVHPTITPSPDLSIIHFAAPFLGFLYVVAEFVGGDVFHYWLQSSGVWQANHDYQANDVVTPTTPNGLLFKAIRLAAPYPSWAPNVPRAVNDIVEPTTYNGFFYTVIEADGDTPASGTVEPVWPTSDGAQIIEDVDSANPDTPTTNAGPAQSGVPNSITDRYGTGTTPT